MPETVRAHRSLQEEAKQILRQCFGDAPGPRRRVLWWDAGGHLRGLLKRVCREMDIDFVGADHPLELRQWTHNQGEVLQEEPGRVLWHVPEPERDRDWFRDVKVMGGIVKKSIADLAADLYDIQPWQLQSRTDGETVSGDIAGILKDRLTVPNRPILQDLQIHLITGKGGKPVEFILQEGTGGLPEASEDIGKVRRHLEDKHVPNLSTSDDPGAIAQKVRRWAVAGWLSDAGVPPSAFPEPIASSQLGYGFRRLRSVLKDTPVLGTYQQSYWPDVIGAVEDPWALGGCPVDGALDETLWAAWTEDFEAGRFETCRERAEMRADAFREHTGREDESTHKGSSPWIRVWQQAAALADLARRYETWDDRDVPAPALYADREAGSWQIDAAVRRIIVSGTPEEELPGEHPARSTLPARRERLVEEKYLKYLETMADKMEQSISTGDLLGETLQSSVKFWPDHEEKLGAGNEALFFYLDALRLDLAYELSDRLQDRSDASRELDLNVDESARLGALPSETEFGMAAVLPGSARSYEVRIGDDELNAYRDGRTVSAQRRRDILNQEGWAVAPDNPSAWSSTQVAYFSKELDEYGEAGMDDIENKLAKRVDTLADLIFEKMRQGNWTRAYVVTDHGFVLLPPQTGFDDQPTPEGDVKRRRVAAEELSEDGPGVLLERGQIPDLFYLASPVRALLHPQHRFKKEGIEDSRYYHGGALPQECVLSFLKIEAA